MEADTVIADVAAAPTADAVTVAVPAVAPATVTTYWPDASVKPAGVVTGVIVNVPVPEAVTPIAAPAIALPPASFAVKVIVTGDVPVLGTVEPVETAVSVEPTICSGIWAVTPALAVMVAVRLALLVVPEEKVKVALPVVSVVTVEVLRMPVSALKATATFGTAAFVAVSAVSVIVVDEELSDLTVVGEAESEMDATPVGVLVGVAAAAVTPLPPQLANRAVIAASINAIQVLV